MVYDGGCYAFDPSLFFSPFSPLVHPPSLPSPPTHPLPPTHSLTCTFPPFNLLTIIYPTITYPTITYPTTIFPLLPPLLYLFTNTYSLIPTYYTYPLPSTHSFPTPLTSYPLPPPLNPHPDCRCQAAAPGRVERSAGRVSRAIQRPRRSAECEDGENGGGQVGTTARRRSSSSSTRRRRRRWTCRGGG